MKPQVEPNHYFNESYDSKERFISYWHQINEIVKLKPKRVLEIGVGNSFVSQYLKNRNMNIVTLDIDERLEPDIPGSILDIPFADGSFDAIASYEVLEHLPYDNVKKALSEIYRVSQKHAILSLPDCTLTYRFCISIPKISMINKLIPLPRFRVPQHVFDGEHYWEIGKAGYPLNRIIKDIRRAGFNVKRTYRLFENPYHRFFILEK